MADYSQYIHKSRRSRPTPASIVDEDGRCVFGTFDREFSDFDLEKAKRPTRAPQNMNKLRLTLWEAAEIHVPEGILLTAVCDMGLFGTVMVLFYDQKTGKVYNWSSTLPSSGTKIAPDLIEDTVTEAETSSGFVRFINDFGSGRAHLTGSLKNGVLTGEKKGTAGVVYDLHLTKITDPSIVCIPFGPNRPLYTEKAFFKATGTITLNGKNLTVNEDTTAVIDDHRGYYPRRMHFDWTAAMGRYPVGYNGENEFISFNLTKNQSTDPEQYNENLIFRENGTSLLPPVNFERDIKTSDFKGHAIWMIKDAYDMVNIQFHIRAIAPTVVHAGVINIDYYVVFGKLTGYLRMEDGSLLRLDGMTGIGEDKTMLF